MSVVSNAASAASRLILPSFVRGPPPLAASQYVIDCAHYAASGTLTEDPPRELAQRMLETYDKHGVVLLRNTGAGENLAGMSRLAHIALPAGMESYEAGANPRKQMADDVDVFDVGAPAAATLQYHHEMAYTNESVSAISFTYSGDPGIGPTYLSANLGATDDILKLDVGKKLKDKGISYIRCLTDKEQFTGSQFEAGVYNHWQQSFGTDDPEEATARANAKGLEVVFGPERYMKTRFTASAFEYHPKTDRNLLFSSVADDGMWFDSWPGVMEMPSMESFDTATPRQRPLKITYGDGTDFTREELIDFVSVYDNHGFEVDWRAGDVLVFCNYLYAHGRKGFDLPEGKRRDVGVILGPRLPRIGDLPDKW